MINPLDYLPWWTTIDWRHTKPLFVLCALEFPLTVAGLALYGIADPDTYRSALWTEGSKLGYNSDPIEILYAYANYKPIPTPTPWNQFITDFNVAIIVASMFILLAKTVMYIIHVLPPFFSALVHAILVALFAVSIYNQQAGDYSDPAHIAAHPWYLIPGSVGCGDPVPANLQSYCREAQASFAVAVLLCTLFSTYFIYSVIMAFPLKEQKAEALEKQADEKAAREFIELGKSFEMEAMKAAVATPKSPAFGSRAERLMGGPATGMAPVTPRTLAFNTLDGTVAQPKRAGAATAGGAVPGRVGFGPSAGPNRDLPLRHHIAMGDDTYNG